MVEKIKIFIARYLDRFIWKDVGKTVGVYWAPHWDNPAKSINIVATINAFYIVKGHDSNYIWDKYESVGDEWVNHNYQWIFDDAKKRISDRLDKMNNLYGKGVNSKVHL